LWIKLSRRAEVERVDSGGQRAMNPRRSSQGRWLQEAEERGTRENDERKARNRESVREREREKGGSATREGCVDEQLAKGADGGG